MPNPIWHGTEEEAFAVLSAIDHWCRENTDPQGEHCKYDLEGRRSFTCAAHTMLNTNQRAINGLVYFRHLRDRLKYEEWLRHKPPKGA